jgi:hypothetical protein
MTLRERKPRLWVEFSEGFGPKIALNSTGFHHSHLFFDYARAYRKAARQLFEQYWQAEDFQDMDMHPIVFLYRHAVEVYLKTILSLGNGVLLINRKPLRTGAKIFNGHKLRPMLPGIGEIFDLIDCSGLWRPPTFNSFSDVKRMVEALDQIEHDAFRYSLSVNGKTELLEEPLCFSAFDFAEKTDALLDVLEAVARQTDETFQKY